MKILVFSDSHQKSNYMKEAIDYNLESGDIDCIFHLGDGVRDLEGLTLRIPICYVDGNYEEYVTNYLSRKNLRNDAVLDLGGFKFFLTHGHRYGVKSDLAPARVAARRAGADVLIYGHTHEQFYDFVKAESKEGRGLHVFNPGSISRPRDNLFSYGIIEIEDGEIKFSHESVQP